MEKGCTLAYDFPQSKKIRARRVRLSVCLRFSYQSYLIHPHGNRRRPRFVSGQGVSLAFPGGVVVLSTTRRNRLLKVLPVVEMLEDRLTPSWGSTPPATITPPSSYTSVTLNGSGDATGNTTIATTEIDWYRFTATTGGSYIFQATTPSSSVDTVIATYTSAGSRVGYNDDITPGSNTDSRFTVTLTTGAVYFFGVTNYTGTAGGAYTWLIDGPATASDDSFENNDTLATAYNLGTLTAAQTYTGLKMADAADYFKFTMNGAGTTANSVAIAFTHAQGDLDMKLYNSAGTQVGISQGTGNSETISLNGLAAGTYTVHVYGYQGVFNPNYSMTINPGTGGGGGGSSHTVYYNFDGATISRANLVSWAGGFWDPNQLDSDQNGINVSPFLASRSDREAIITQILAYIQADLNPYGMTVQRTTGLAVTGVGATTVFFGPATLTGGGYHIACDIDMGNNNPTDIAFVGDEDWGTAADTALAMADVGLHEAGHTFGLWHVASGTNPESMGLRYNTPQSQWLTNTFFMDQTFNAYVSGGVAHGPGPQNSHQTMLAAFGGGGGGGGGPSGNLAMSGVDHYHMTANGYTYACATPDYEGGDLDGIAFDHDHASADTLTKALVDPAPFVAAPTPVKKVPASIRTTGQDFDAWRTALLNQNRSALAGATPAPAPVTPVRPSDSRIIPANQTFETWRDALLTQVRRQTSTAAFAAADAGNLSFGRLGQLPTLLG